MAKRIILVGAGAWGGWTAFHLQKAGCQVTLIDKGGPGNTLAGSGGKTRIIRLAYGGSEVYTDLTEQSLNLWEHYTQEWNEDLALWMFRGIPSTYADLSVPLMKRKGYALEQLPLADLPAKYPEIDFSDVTDAYWEPKAGYLEASRSCGVVKDKFVELGGKYLERGVSELISDNGELSAVKLDSGEVLEADQFVLACGPWLTQLVPQMEQYIHVSRQEVYYFDAPSNYYDLPIWVEFREGDQMFYGIPDHFEQGFKFAYDERTWGLDPDNDHREVTEEILTKMKNILVNRFPAMANAKVLKHHTCVYENSSDGDFIIDHIPGSTNAIMLAGSSGHGFKMGPAIGQLISDHILSASPIPSEFSLDRFSGSNSRKSQYEV